MPDTKRIWIMGGGKPPFMFDAVLKESHTSELVTPENPTETGVPLTDHAYMQRDKLEIEAGIGDIWLAMRNPLDGNTPEELVGAPFKDMPWLAAEGSDDSSSRSQRAYQLLRGLQRSAEPFDIQTGLRLYKNMVVSTLTTDQDKDSSGALIFRATLSEVIRVGTETVTFPPRKEGKAKHQASKKADNGEKKTGTVIDPNKGKSILDSFLPKDVTDLPSLKTALDKMLNGLVGF